MWFGPSLEKAGGAGSSEDDPPAPLNHTRDRGDGRGLNPPPDERGPAVIEYDDPSRGESRRVATPIGRLAIEVDATVDTSTPSSRAAGSDEPGPQWTRSDDAAAGPRLRAGRPAAHRGRACAPLRAARARRG